MSAKVSSQLNVSIGQYSDKGRKEVNQDFHGAYIPKGPLLALKGVALVLADGISSSDVSQIASATAVKSFLDDYYCTSEVWSVKKSAQQVLTATNSWLYAQSRQSEHRFDRDKGYVCTISALIIKSTTAHILHAGDARVYRLSHNALEQLTKDHRYWVSQDISHLSRALGISQEIEIDYQALQIQVNDIFLLATDGVYEFVAPDLIISLIQENVADLNLAAQKIADKAYQLGSADNLTIQIVLINALPELERNAIPQELTELPFPPMLEARALFDGYQIVRQMHASSRSHVYLALETETNSQVILKTPSIDLRDDPAYLERFLMEEWIARRINSPHVLKPCSITRSRNYLYIITEFIEGQTLAQWMIDHPKPSVETVRGIVEQIAKGLLAFHRMEMLHQDLRPENIMIDKTGTVKIIDFGSTSVAGILEITTSTNRNDILGTAQYAAPEYFLGEGGTSRSDLYSLGVITYQMLAGRLPYGAEVAKSRTKAAQRKLSYDSVLADDQEIPAWIDETLKKAVHPNPFKRYQELSEYIYDLRHPNTAFLNKARAPLLERNPVLFWKGVSAIQLLIIFLLLYKSK